MTYYRTCPDCGTLLDPGEKCDCAERSEQLKKKYEELTAADIDGQIKLLGKEKEKQ